MLACLDGSRLEACLLLENISNKHSPLLKQLLNNHLNHRRLQSAGVTGLWQPWKRRLDVCSETKILESSDEQNQGVTPRRVRVNQDNNNDDQSQNL